MAKKISKQAQYVDILQKDGIAFDACKVLAFTFDDAFGFSRLHYLLMAEPERKYYIFDVIDGGPVQVVCPAEAAEHICKAASMAGGSKTTPKLI